MTNEQKALEALWDFAHQRPGFDWRDYGWDGRKYYNQDRGRAYRDLVRFRKLYSQVVLKDYAPGAFERLTAGQRLEWDGKRWEYTAGQYYCVEFRSSAVNLLEGISRAFSMGGGWWNKDTGPA